MKSTELLWIPPRFRYALAMILKEILLDEIDLEDATFRISENLDSASVLDSLRKIGQLNPVVLLDRGSRKVIVCGFRRVRAMERLGESPVFARILSEENCTPAQAFELALQDTLSHRQLGPLEKARVLFKLRVAFGVSEDTLVRVYLPLLDLPPHENVLHAYIALDGVRPGLRRCLVEGRLTHSSVEKLAGMPDRVQDNIAALVERIRLSAGLQRKVLTLLEELSAMADSPLDAPLNNPEVPAILEDSRLSPFQKGEKLHEVLYRLRNPRLSRALDRFLAQKKLLGLPGAIRIVPHPFFETADLRVEFDAPDVERFRELAAALYQAAQLPELEQLFHMDG
jgi:hypothetical protein